MLPQGVPCLGKLECISHGGIKRQQSVTGMNRLLCHSREIRGFGNILAAKWIEAFHIAKRPAFILIFK